MSVPPGPPDQDTTDLAGTRTSSVNGPSGQFTDPTLQELVYRLQDPGIRWQTLKWLRVARLGLHHVLTADEMPLIPKAYYEIYADPRLSEVARLMNCTKIALNPIHLDLDWFGLKNWWRGDGVHGPEWQLAVTAGLVNLLESSFGLGHSNEHYDNWTWPSTSYGSPWESLELEPPPSAPPTAITVIWELNKHAAGATCDAPAGPGADGGWLLKLTTPVPKKNRDTILQ